jgi:hypothetical protein
VYFTSATIVSSAVLFRGFGSSNPTVIGTVCLGFLGTNLFLRTLTEVICGGVILLQLAKTADKISDAQQLSSGLNDVKELAEVEKGEDEPGADAIRGALSIRRYSTVRRPSRATNVDPSLTGSPIPLKNRRKSRKDGHFFDLPPDFGRRESTIREVPAEEESRSSVQFDPSAPVTHIYPPRRTSSPDKYRLGDNLEEVDYSRTQAHNPLSPVAAPDFLSAPPTPRYPIPKRANVQKTYSFGRSGKSAGKTAGLTEEETMGLVLAGQNEAGASDRDTDSPHHTEHSEESDFEAEESRGGRRGKPYEMF